MKRLLQASYLGCFFVNNITLNSKKHLPAYLINFSDLCQRNQETTAGVQCSEAKRPPRIQQLGSHFKNLK